MSEAIYRMNGGQQDYTPSSAAAAGEIIQLSDGRAAVVKTTLAASEKGAVYTSGIFDVDSASATTFLIGADVYWDTSASLAIGYAAAQPDDILIGTAVKAKVATELVVRVDLNAVPLVNSGILQSFVVEFDCEAGTLNEAKTLVPAAWNKRGLLLLAAIGEITEVMGGDSEDQGIITIKDTAGSPATLSVLTPSNAGADASGDIVLGTLGAIGLATGSVLSKVTAGLGITGQITQKTSGASAAGKVKVRVLVAPLA